MGGRPGVSIDILYRRENHRRAAWRAGDVAGLDFGRERFRSGHTRPLHVPNAAMPSYETIILSVHDSDRFDCVPEPDVYQYPNDSATRGLFDLQEKMINEQHICLRWADR